MMFQYFTSFKIIIHSGEYVKVIYLKSNIFRLLWQFTTELLFTKKAIPVMHKTIFTCQEYGEKKKE